VELWFRVKGARNRTGGTPTLLRRVVYLATEDPAVVKEVQVNYPHYKVYANKAASSIAGCDNRYSGASLLGVLTDLRLIMGIGQCWLSNSN